MGSAEGNPELNIWPELLLKWMRERGLASAAMQQHPPRP
jgi:hypothetical protein